MIDLEQKVNTQTMTSGTKGFKCLIISSPEPKAHMVSL